MGNKEMIQIFIHKVSTRIVSNSQVLVIGKGEDIVERSDKAIKSYLPTLGMGRGWARC